MASQSSQHDELQAVIQRYGEVADAVNRREMQRFIDEVTSKWHPENYEDWEVELRADGYTDAGALNLHIYWLAFGYHDPPYPTDRPLCEAEKQNQILLQPPVESLVDLIPKPLADPAPSDQILVKLEAVEAALRRQAEASGSTQQIHLPQDVATLMALTDGIHGAGVPEETDHQELIFPLERQRVEPDVLTAPGSWVLRRDQRIPIAVWKIGGCGQHREINYVLCQSADAVSSSWKIIDWDGDVEIHIHEDLTHFIRHETERIQTPGATMIQEILTYNDSFPIYQIA